jgi:hypothetical protein
MSALRDVIRMKVEAGELPSQPSSRFTAAFGEGRPCSACGAPICRDEAEWSMRDGDGLTHRFHVICYSEWDAVLGTCFAENARLLREPSLRGVTE